MKHVKAFLARFAVDTPYPHAFLLFFLRNTMLFHACFEHFTVNASPEPVDREDGSHAFLG
jgi:hypothetical protein